MDYPKLGPTQAIIMHRALDEAGGFSVVVGPERECRAARMLNSKGFLVRDKARADLYFATDKAKTSFAGWVYQPEIDGGVIVEALAPGETVTQLQVVGGASDLAIIIRRAQGLFDDGDYDAAMMLASGAYDQAKAAAGYARRMQASEQLISKALRMQADALLIESRAKMALADEYDHAQAAGLVAVQGRPKKVSDENLFRLEDVGLSKAKVFEARKLRDAEVREPGFIERVVETRVAEGLEPSRAVLKKEAGHAIGTKSASKDERGDQLYETPAEATRTLLALESFSGIVKEPAVGRGAILRVLEDAGYDVLISDLRDRDVVTRDGELQQVGDFLHSQPGDTEGTDIVTNPPYGDVANAFLAHALKVHKPRKMAALLNLNFMCGFEDPDRVFLMHDNPPSRVYVFSRRLPMMHRDGWDGPKASSQMNTAWFVWERNDEGFYGLGNGTFETIRVDWQRYQSAPLLAPGVGGHAGPIVFDYLDDEDYTRTTPRKSLDERVDEERVRALIWAAEHDGFDASELRRGIGVRPSTADALITAMQSDGHLQAGDQPERFVVTDDGWRVLRATAGAALALGLVGEVAA